MSPLRREADCQEPVALLRRLLDGEVPRRQGKRDIGCDFFNRFVMPIAKCGPYEVAPAKTRVAFMAAVRFASVNWVGRDFIDGISSFRGRSTAPDSAKSNTWASCMCTT